MLALSLGVVILAGILAPLIVKRRAPPFVPRDLVWLALGGVVMLAAAVVQLAPASAWSPLVDLGSLAVGTSLLVTCAPGTWPRHVGALILGIHLAQVIATNPGAPFAGILGGA